MINQSHRHIRALFITAGVLAVAGPAFLLNNAKSTVVNYSMPNPPQLNFTETQLAALQSCRTGVLPSKPLQVAKGAKEVPVIMYHRVVNEKPSREVIHPKRFRLQMDALKQKGYTTVSVQQLTDYMNGKGEMPDKPILITFDDGWKDNIEAAEYLKKIDFGATWYVVSGFFGAQMYLDETELKELAKNPKFEFGSHMHTHFIKHEGRLSTSLDLCTMAEEMLGSKLILEKMLQRPVTSLAWPYGYNTNEAITLAKHFGYTSTMHVNSDAYNASGHSPFYTRRMNIDGNCNVNEFMEMVETRTLKECS